MIPPPIIADTKIASTIVPGSKYWMYGTYGYTSTTESVATLDSRCGNGLWLYGSSNCVNAPSSAEAANWSVLSSISAIRGEIPANTLRENCGGMLRTALIFP